MLWHVIGMIGIVFWHRVHHDRCCQAFFPLETSQDTTSVSPGDNSPDCRGRASAEPLLTTAAVSSSLFHLSTAH